MLALFSTCPHQLHSWEISQKLDHVFMMHQVSHFINSEQTVKFITYKMIRCFATVVEQMKISLLMAALRTV